MSEDEAADLAAADPPALHLVFDIAGAARALPVAQVREVMRVAPITRVPHAPEHVRGLTSLRGRLVPVIDVGARAADAAARIVVVALAQRLVGVLVDRVGGVRPLPDDVVAFDVEALARDAP